MGALLGAGTAGSALSSLGSTASGALSSLLGGTSPAALGGLESQLGLASGGTGLTGFGMGALNQLLSGSPGLTGFAPQLGGALGQLLSSGLGGSPGGSLLLNGAQMAFPHPATRMAQGIPPIAGQDQRSVVGGIISGILGQ